MFTISLQNKKLITTSHFQNTKQISNINNFESLNESLKNKIWYNYANSKPYPPCAARLAAAVAVTVVDDVDLV